MTLPDLSRARRKLGFETTGGLLGHPVTQAITDGSGSYWVRPVQSTGSYAPPVPLPLMPGQSVPPLLNWPVRLGFDRTGRAVILGVDTDSMRAQNLPTRSLNPLDVPSRYVPKELLSELLCIPHPSLAGYAKVYPGKLVFGDQAVLFAGDDVDVLTGNDPGSGNHAYVAVFLTPAGALEVQSSTPQATGSALGVSDVQECLNAVTAGSLLIRTFKVVDGDIELDGDLTNSPDWRALWAHHPQAPDAADVTYTPTTLSDWTGSADPGNQDDANDQLASRVTTLEAGGAGRELLSANRDYYVDGTLGSDSNDGLSSGAGAFATWQKAINTVGGLDVSIYDVTIHVADGTYSENITLKNFVGAGRCTIEGNTGTPANVILSGSANTITATGVTSLWTLDAFQVQSSGGSAVFLENGSTGVTLGTLVYGSVTAYHILCVWASIVILGSNYTISGGGAGHFYAGYGGEIKVQSAPTVTLSGTPAFSVAFLYMPAAGIASIIGVTFSGSATGTRYTINLNSVCNVNGAGATYLPGNAAGSTATGGQYA